MERILDCSIFFSSRVRPFDYYPCDRIPKFLKPTMRDILDDIEDTFGLEVQPNQAKVSTIPEIRVIEISVPDGDYDINFFIVDEEDTWSTYEEEEFNELFNSSDSDSFEDVYVPPETPQPQEVPNPFPAPQPSKKSNQKRHRGPK